MRNGGGQTYYSADGLAPEHSLRKAVLAANIEKLRKLENALDLVDALGFEKCNNFQRVLSHCFVLLKTYTWQNAYKIYCYDYAMLGQRMRRVALFAYSGVHLQFPLVPNASGLCCHWSIQTEIIMWMQQCAIRISGVTK